MKKNFLPVLGMLALELLINPAIVKAQDVEIDEDKASGIIEQFSEDYTKAFEEAFEGVPEAEKEIPGLMGIVDIVYGTAENFRTNTITGSNLAGFRFPCFASCAYIELAGQGNVYGKQWISGKNQKVPGGTGPFGALFNFREPTGRFPVGSEFKVVVWDVDESQGTADLRGFFRVCKPAPANCTPYVLPPGGIPLWTVREKDFLFIGIIEPGL